jgi:hypothetical protein
MPLLILLLVLSTLEPTGPCGPYHAGAHADLNRFLTSPELATARTNIGVTSAEFSSVNHISDYSTCDLVRISAESQGISFQTQDRGFRYIGFESQNFYYLVAIPHARPDGLLDLGPLPLIVMNKSYQVVGGIMR